METTPRLIAHNFCPVSRRRLRVGLFESYCYREYDCESKNPFKTINQTQTQGNIFNNKIE